MRKLLLIAATAALAIGVSATVAVATHNYGGGATTVQVVADGGPGGNASCPANTITGLSRVAPANFSNAFLIVSGVDGKTFDWAFTALGNQTYDMAVVIVKGGPNSAIYTYDFTANPAFDDSDQNLAAPNNPNGGGQPKDYGLSNLTFCFDPKGGGDN